MWFAEQVSFVQGLCGDQSRQAHAGLQPKAVPEKALEMGGEGEDDIEVDSDDVL